jgi:hypothetical protein
MQKRVQRERDDKRPKASSGKGAQWADYAKRWSMKEIDKTLGCIKKKILNTGKYE